MRALLMSLSALQMQTVKTVLVQTPENRLSQYEVLSGFGKEVQLSVFQDAFLDVIPSGVRHITDSFHYSKTIDMAPFPCLEVSNLGTIGLPLSQQDAHSFISFAERVPFHHGRRTALHRNTANIWEIGADCVSFGNPKFLEYLRSLVLKDVLQALGVNPFSVAQRDIVLDKLLLYRTASW